MQESIAFLVRLQCRRKESSRSLSHLLMSFLFIISAALSVADKWDVWQFLVHRTCIFKERIDKKFASVAAPHIYRERIRECLFEHQLLLSCNNKKLIRRWDSERELSLRRHCTRTKNAIDSFINSATDRFLQRRFTKFSEITQCNGHYAVQGHSRSPILVPIESSYTTTYLWLILTYLLSCIVSKLWLIIGQISLTRAESLTLSLSLGGGPCQYRHKWYIAKS